MAKKETPESAGWATGITLGTLIYTCHYKGAKGELKVKDDGIYFSSPLGKKVRLPWPAIASIEVASSQHQHGNQRNAIGMGVVGAAVVGATVLHNRKARQVDTLSTITITDKTGQGFRFQTEKLSQSALNEVNAIKAKIPRSRTTAENQQRVADSLAAMDERLGPIETTDNTGADTLDHIDGWAGFPTLDN